MFEFSRLFLITVNKFAMIHSHFANRPHKNYENWKQPIFQISICETYRCCYCNSWTDKKIMEQVCMNNVIMLLYAWLQVWKGVISARLNTCCTAHYFYVPHCVSYCTKVPKYCNLPCCSDIMWSYNSNIMSTLITLFTKRKHISKLPFLHQISIIGKTY